jgi:hypothetical protein
MPYVIRKLKNKNLYSVKNAKTGVIHSSGTTKAKAEAQVRLFNLLKKG